eukprot:1151750-Pelagomonas_calceolata.AAC.1
MNWRLLLLYLDACSRLRSWLMLDQDSVLSSCILPSMRSLHAPVPHHSTEGTKQMTPCAACNSGDAGAAVFIPFLQGASYMRKFRITARGMTRGGGGRIGLIMKEHHPGKKRGKKKA